MKKCFYVSSCIEIDASAPLSYSPTRSCFSDAERYRQTIATINTISCLSPTATIYVLDASEHYTGYAQELQFLFRNCVFVPMREISTSEEYMTIRRHPNKSLGEALTLRNFITAFEHELQHYDFCFKLSGRYLLTNTYTDTFFTEERVSQIFFKTPLSFPWNPEWTYDKIDVRQEEGHNNLKQYCSVFYGYGKNHLQTFLDLYRGMVSILKHPSMLTYDAETLLYFLIKDYQESITTIPVQVLGWLGPSGDLMKY